MSTVESAEVCISKLCLNELTIDVITAGATIGALVLSALLGFFSLKFTRADQKVRRIADEERRTRVFGYGEKRPGGVLVKVTNGTDYPIRNVGVIFFSYTTSPKLEVLDSGSQTVIPFLGPGVEETLPFQIEDMRGYIGIRLSFIDINGQAWVRRPDGKVLKQEDLGKSSGFDLPADMYLYRGPHTSK